MRSRYAVDAGEVAKRRLIEPTNAPRCRYADAGPELRLSSRGGHEEAREPWPPWEPRWGDQGNVKVREVGVRSSGCSDGGGDDREDPVPVGGDAFEGALDLGDPGQS